MNPEISESNQAGESMAQQQAPPFLSGLGGLSELLKLPDQKRPVPHSVSHDQPLIGLAWRVMSEEKRRVLARVAADDRELDKLLTDLALLGDFLAKALRLLEDQNTGTLPQWAIRLRNEARAIEPILDFHKVRVICPSGLAFEGDLLEIFDNVGQQVNTNAEFPVVDEVIEPAILRSGALLHMGKAVIGMPSESNAARVPEN